MGEGVTEQALAAEDGETAEDAADDAKQCAAEGNGAQGVVVLDLEENLAEGYEQGCYERDGADQEPDAPVGTAVFSSQFMVYWSFDMVGSSARRLGLRIGKNTLFVSTKGRKGPRNKPFFIHEGPLRTTKKNLFPRRAAKGHEENLFPMKGR